MELSFVISALKRRWWVVLIFAELGVLPLILGGAPVTQLYESDARMEILPPEGARTSAAQPDRYVLSQIEVLNGRAIADEVAQRLGDPDEAEAVRRSTAVEHIAETDIVRVAVRQDDKGRAQLVAQTIIETYIERLVEADAATRDPDIARYTLELDALRLQLDEVNNNIVQLMEPYLTQSQQIGFSVPPVNVVAPNEVSEQTFLTADIQRIELLRSALVSEPSSVNSKIVQPASLPGARITESNGIFEIAFLIGMILVGITVALLWARLSKKLLDELHANEALGVPVVARLKKSKPLKHDPLVAFQRLPQDLISGVDQIAVRAEALAKIDQPLTIAVVGSQRGSGTTTTAVALAARFAAAEYSVLLVDADRRDSWITDVLGSTEHGGIPALVGATDEGTDRIFSRTSEQDVRVLGLGSSAGALRRESVPALVKATLEAANIVIFDGGPLLDAAATVELTNAVDAVVLAVPLSSARTDDLEVVTRQLSSISHKVLPVLTSPSGRTASREAVATNHGADSLALGGELVSAAQGRDRGNRSGSTSQRRRPSEPDAPEKSVGSDDDVRSDDVADDEELTTTRSGPNAKGGDRRSASSSGRSSSRSGSGRSSAKRDPKPSIEPAGGPAAGRGSVTRSTTGRSNEPGPGSKRNQQGDRSVRRPREGR